MTRWTARPEIEDTATCDDCGPDIQHSVQALVTLGDRRYCAKHIGSHVASLVEHGATQ